MPIGKKKTTKKEEPVVEAVVDVVPGTCTKCNGTGLIDRETLCDECGGTGHYSQLQ